MLIYHNHKSNVLYWLKRISHNTSNVFVTNYRRRYFRLYQESDEGATGGETWVHILKRNGLGVNSRTAPLHSPTKHVHSVVWRRILCVLHQYIVLQSVFQRITAISIMYLCIILIIPVYVKGYHRTMWQMYLYFCICCMLYFVFIYLFNINSYTRDTKLCEFLLVVIDNQFLRKSYLVKFLKYRPFLKSQTDPQE